MDPRSNEAAKFTEVTTQPNSLPTQVERVAGVINRHLHNSLEQPQAIAAIDPTTILPFVTPILPASPEVLAKNIPGYVPPTAEQIAEMTTYADAKENYGTMPGKGAAFLVQLVKALKPETAFVFGTARGRIEQLIAKNHDGAAIVTIDLPQAEVETAKGRPDSNNIRYRKNIGIGSDENIGDIFKNDPEVSSRINQLLGDSRVLNTAPLAGTMRLVVVDGNHALPNCLSDIASALEMIHTQGGIIAVDDFKKASPLNMGVDAAVNILNTAAGLAVLWPCPKPKEDGLEAPIAVIPVAAGFNVQAAAIKLRSIVAMLEAN
jgi:predicted O-methyltransferase YrrM